MELNTTKNFVVEDLTAAQKEAVATLAGPLLILAGPGSGKTRVVTHRIANMIEQGIPSHQILALTFTNKAANEMKSRLHRVAPGNNVFASTFHRFCSFTLRQYASLAGLSDGFSIYDVSDAKKLIKNVVSEHNIQHHHYTIDEIQKSISRVKQDLIEPENYEPRQWMPSDAVVAQIYPLYQKALLTSNAVDFDDLLFHTAILLRTQEVREELDERYQYISVDEYQDTNGAQYEIIRAISQNYQNIAVTGDPDQSIYGWRGANINNILDFEKDYPSVKMVRLEQNYRSTKAILRVADQLIANNLKRKQKKLFTDNEEGKPVRLIMFPTQRDEATQIAERIGAMMREGHSAKDFAIFYRVNAFSRTLESALRREGLAYQIVNGYEFYQRKEVKDILAYLQILVNPRNEVALERVINVPSRKIGKVTMERIRRYARKYGVSILDAVFEAKLNEELSKQARTNVMKFGAIIERMIQVIDQPVEEIMGTLLSETGYRQMFDIAASPDDEEKVANIDELLNAAREYDDENPDGDLEGFLEQTSLVSDIDGWDNEDERVTMMTLHAAKGLEFPFVFIVGVEENVLPHSRSREDLDAIEEERRLFFVGITRAEKELQIGYSTRRLIRGTMQMTAPSRFLMELPRDEMEIVEPTSKYEFFDELDDYDDTYRNFADEARDEPVVTEPAKIMTAADMLPDEEKQPPVRYPVHLFEQDMLVAHDVHGTGKIIALSGSGKKRVATVEFFQNGRRKFMLAHAPLRPIKS